MLLFMRSRSCLLILPSSGFAGLISLHVGWLAKLSLWSFKVMYAFSIRQVYVFNVQRMRMAHKMK